MEAIYEGGGSLSFAMTLEDDQAVNKSGRVYLDDFCRQNGIPLHKSRHVNNSDVIASIKHYDLDWLFIIGWSQIASADVLAAPKQGALGIHPTLLPMGRGRAAIPWAILKGLDRTGVTLFKLDAGVDTGPIVDQVEIPLSASSDAGELYKLVDQAHVNLMKKVVPALMAGTLVLKPQDDSLATEWPGRKPEDGEIDLSGSVIYAERLVRAVTKPYPGAFTYLNGEKILVWKARIVSESSTLPTLRFSDGLLGLLEYEATP